jgi:hypothetical protein
MGLFGFGKKSVSNKEIDNVVMSHFQKLGSPGDIGQKSHEEKFIKMLNELDQWAEIQGFGDWKRSAISGSIEAILRKTYRNCGVDNAVSAYLQFSQKIIMKM